MVCVFLLIFILCGVAYADNALEQWRIKADSTRQLLENDVPLAYAKAKRLQVELPANATPFDRVRLLNLLSRIENYLGKTEISATHARQAFDLAKQHEDKAGQTEASMNIALNAVNQGDIDAMVAAGTHSLAILDDIGRPDLLAEVMLCGSMMYTRLEMLEESISIAVRAMEIARRGNDDLMLAYAYQGMAVAYEQNARYMEARDNYAEMLKHARAAHSKILEGTALNGIGAMLNALGDHQEGEHLIRLALDLYHEVGAPFYLARSLFVLAENLHKQGQLAEALPLLDEAVAIFRQRANKIGLWSALFQRSANYLDLGKLALADADAQDAYRLAEEIKFPVYLSKSARQLSAISASQGDYRQAYRLSVEADELSAKAASDNAGKRIIELTQRYQSESKQREIDKLNRRNQQQATKLAHRAFEQRWLITVLGGSVIILVGTAFFLVRLRRSHRRLVKLNAEALQAKNKLQATLDAIPDLMFEVGLDGRYYDCHSPQSELLAAPADILLTKTVSEVMPADAAAICLASLNEAHQHGRSLGKQLLLPLPHGDCWFELSVAQKPGEVGEEPRFIVMSRDITERKRMEDALLVSRRILTEAQRIAHVGSWELNLETNTLSWSDEIFRIFEIDPQEFDASYDAFIAMIHPDDRDAVDIAYIESLTNREPYQIEHRLQMPDGRIKYVFERCATSFSDDGMPLRSFGTVQDITQRKQATEALVAREREFRTLAESLPDNIVRYDREGRIIYVNPVLEKTLGAIASKIMGKTVREWFPNGEYDDYALLLDSVLACGEIGEIEKIVTPSYGNLHLVHNIRMVAEHDENGEVIGVLAIGRDITERKLAEEALRDSEEKYRTLVEKIQAAVIVHDADTQILVSNPLAQEILGLTANQLHGKTAIDPAWHFHHEDGRLLTPEEYPVNQVLVSGKALKNCVLSVYRPGRQDKVWVLINADPVFGKNGAIIQVIVTFIDITERKQVERRLWLMDFALNQVGEAVYIIDVPNSNLITVNDEACRALGYSREELLRMSVLDIDPDGDGDRKEMKQLQNAIDGDLAVFERRHKTKDGRIFPVEISAKVFDYEGRPTSIALARDITERKRAEHDIAIMSQALGKVHEAAYLTDENGGFLYVNDASCRALGYSRDELLTMSVMDIGPGWTVEMVRGVLQRPADEAAQAFEAVHLRKDGSRFPVEINASQFEYAGKSYGLALVRDITERKRAEDEILALNAELEQRVLERTEALRLQTRYLRTLIDTLPMMAWLKDKQSRFLVVNQTMALACTLSVDEMIGKSDLDCWQCDYAESCRAGDSEVMATAQRKTVEEVFVDTHNNMMWVETFKAPVLDEDGSVLGTVGIARDISDRKAMDAARASALAEAERLAQLRSEFMSRISHELRTPLNGILGYAQILLGESKGNERQRTMLNVIQQSGDYLLSLINDILDFAKIEAGKQELNLGNVPLRRFLSSLSNIVTIKAEQKGLFFMCDIAEAVPAGIRADETRLRQVLLNLLSNAVKYTERGQVSLRVTVLDEGDCIESSRLRFEIQDTGVGIDNAQLDTIFQAFEQVGSNQQRTGGTGLGLPISRELVKLMGGNIQVSSRVGEGSNFWFDLDVPVVEVCGDILVDEQPIAGYHGLRRRILVVDDVDENRALLIEILGGLGFETCEAANGRACLDSVEAKTPDLILLDRVMPEMDGLETVRRLRRLPGFGETPVIVVSASALAADITEAMNAGANTFLSKPIEIKRLMAQLAGLLKLDWIYALSETGIPPQYRLNEALVEPPLEEMAILHRLAQEGSMRDIIRYAAHLEELDPRYRPFAAQLRVLAQGYQSKAILELVERYIPPSQV